MIDLRNISIGYSTAILRSDEINLTAGSIYVLIGKNGSGKTTLFNSIIGQQRTLEGTISINDKSLIEMSSKEIAQNIAFVPANFPIVEYMRVFDFVGLGRSPYTNYFGHLSVEDRKVVDQTTKLLGIEDLRDNFVSELSDGQRQLVSIAKALAQDTPVILLDEPLAFLDFSNRRELLEKLKMLASSKNKCIVFSSHDIDVSTSSDFKFLLVNDQQRKVQLYHTPSRDEIIEICFPVR